MSPAAKPIHSGHKSVLPTAQPPRPVHGSVATNQLPVEERTGFSELPRSGECPSVHSGSRNQGQSRWSKELGPSTFSPLPKMRKKCIHDAVSSSPLPSGEGGSHPHLRAFQGWGTLYFTPVATWPQTDHLTYSLPLTATTPPQHSSHPANPLPSGGHSLISPLAHGLPPPCRER